MYLSCYKLGESYGACTGAVTRLYHLVLATHAVTGVDKGIGWLGWFFVSKSLRRRFLDETPLGARFPMASHLGCCDRRSTNTRREHSIRERASRQLIQHNQHHRLDTDGLDDRHFRIENATPCAYGGCSSAADTVAAIKTAAAATAATATGHYATGRDNAGSYSQQLGSTYT